MIDLDEAKRRVLACLDRCDLVDGPAITSIEEHSFGWVFSYTSGRFFHTQEVNDLLAGNNPLIVHRTDGKVYGTRWHTTDSDIMNFPGNRGELGLAGPFPARPWVPQRETISPVEARRIALAFLNSLGVEQDGEILAELTEEYDVGWVFCHTTSRYLKTGDPLDAFPPGNVPILIDRNDGKVYKVGENHPITHYVDRFRQDRNNLICWS